MNNFIFKSANRLIKNSSEDLGNRLDQLLREQRMQRADLAEVLKRLERLMIDKHLQTQVDTYFEDNPNELEDK